MLFTFKDIGMILLFLLSCFLCWRWIVSTRRYKKITDSYRNTLSGIKNGRFEITLKSGNQIESYFDEYCYLILGYKKPKNGKPFEFFSDLLDREYRQKLKETFLEFTEKKEPVDLKAPFRNTKNEIQWIRIQGGVFWEKNSVRLLGTWSDITEEESLRLQLMKERGNFLLIQRVNRMLRWEYKGEDGKISLYRNDKENLEIPLVKLWDYFSEKDRGWVKDLFFNSYKEKQNLDLIAQMSKNIRGDNTNDWLQINGFPDQQNPQNYVGIADVITPLVKSQEQARIQNQLFKALIDHIPYGIFVKEIIKGELRYILWNKALDRLHQRSGEDIDGRTDWDIFPPETAEKHVNEDQLTIKKRSLQDFGECPMTEGSTQTVHYFKIPLMDYQNQVKYILGIVEDITERKNLEKQLLQSQKLDAIGKLAGGVAHDFNNLMAGIMGISELLLTMEKEIHKRDYLNHILGLTHRAAELTNQLLTFSRKGEIRLEPVNLHQCIEEAIQVLKRTIDKNIDIVTWLNAENSQVAGDHGGLMNLFLNLGINARDAMPGGGTLTVKSRNISLNEEERESRHLLHPVEKWIIIDVSDTGEGIDESIKEKVFEPFFTTKKQGEGTGLGLSAVYGSTLKHKGNIHLESSPETGTCFTLYFPLIDEMKD